ncbi:MAG: sigma-54-dependent Fis family transcriptional regulator [Porticoccaceae bacterium]|nr:sigma-54-dependent Fis family transcriptional regulator [Porticoccaceae bacterium]
MVKDAHDQHHHLLILAEETTFNVVDDLVAALPEWDCSTDYAWKNWSRESQSTNILDHTHPLNDLLSAKEPTKTSLQSSQDFESTHPAVGLLALGPAPNDDILDSLEHTLRSAPNTSWVAILSEQHFEHPHLMALVVAYCQDYISYPLSGVTPILSGLLGHLAGMSDLRSAHAGHLATEKPSDQNYNMVGSSTAMKHVFNLVSKYAKADAPVLISGESGSGKELIAQAIHQHSLRADKPFVAVNCGAIPENLLESELFGHIKGAFTGAIQNRDGRITVANGGTLFLDEIGDLSLHQQVKILRFLQEGTFEPVGSSHTQRADVRIITASHIDLEDAVQEGKFRDDLYYRLNVLHVASPPLRERNGDIEQLARYYLSKFSATEFAAGKPGIAKDFSPAALKAIQQHDWPGNVRELINKVKKAAIVSDQPLISPRDLDLDDPQKSSTPTTIIHLGEARGKAEREALEAALQDSQFNISKTATVLGISRMTIYRLLEKHGISH